VLNFHPVSHDVLLSASSDGLLSLTNAHEADEDEAVQEVANWGCSIAKAGWYANEPTGEYNVWASSDMETFGTWKSNLDVLVDYGDIRQPNLHNQWSTNYLIDVSDFSGAAPCDTSGLGVCLGSNSGDIALASIDGSTKHSWTVQGFLRGGHPDSIVRSLMWDKNNGVILTGDEEGRLAAWRPTSSSRTDSDGDVEMEGESADIGSKRRKNDRQPEGAKRRKYDSE